ncbi:MAG: DUF4097 domain-containing protein, partial [Actinobacteria bacterium]
MCSFLLTPLAPGAVVINATVDGSTHVVPGVGAVAVLPLVGTWNVPTGSNDTATATTDTKNLKVTLGDPVEFDVPLFLLRDHSTSSVTIDASASSAATSFDLSGIAANYSNQITLKGGTAGDSFKLEDGFGNVSIDGDSADTVDLSTDTGTIQYTGSDITDGTSGDQLTASGEQINTKLGTHASAIAGDISAIIADLQAAANQLATGANALSTALPLLDPSQGTVAKVLALTDTLNNFANSLASLTPQSVLGALVTELNSAIGSLPDLAAGLPNPLKGLKFGTSFENNGGDMLVYLTAKLSGTTSGCAPVGNATVGGNGNGCITKLIPLAFGTRLDSIGIGLDGDPNTPGVQPPTFTVQATIGTDFAVGFDQTTFSGPIVKDGGHIDLHVDANLSPIGLVISMGLLSASITTTTPIDFAGGLSITIGDGDSDPITTSELAAAINLGAPTVTVSPQIVLMADVEAGVSVGTVSLAHAELDISLTGDFTDTTPVPLFGSNGSALQPNVQVKGAGSPLLDTFANAFSSSFSNAGPNDIISMLGQIASFFTSLAGQSFLGTQIPFTSITLGQVLDYAKEFRHDVLDPLFKSGDATKPDGNGDGKVDINDFNFSSIQQLLDRLDGALGLPAHFLTATFNPATGDLTFPFSFNQVFGIGTGASVLSPGVDLVTSAPLGGGTQFTLTAATGGFTATYKGGSASATIAYDAPLATVQGALTGLPSGSVVRCENYPATSCDGGPFKVLFPDGSSAILSPNQVQQVIVGGTGGTFGVTNGSLSKAGIVNNVSLATFTSDLTNIGLGGTVVRVACSSGAATCAGGPFEIVYD